MAIQAQLYPENLGLPLMGGSNQDWLFMANNQNNNSLINNINNNMFLNGCGFNELSSNNILQQKYQQQYQFQQQQEQQQQQQQQQQVMLQLQQQYLLQQLQNQQQQQRNSCDDNNNNNNDGFVFLSSSKNCKTTTTATTGSTTTTDSDYQMPMNMSSTFVDTLEKQRQEIDRFITLQNERLKLAVQEQKKQQLAVMMRIIEAKTMPALRQKDEEIAKAAKRRLELEEVIRKMQIENQEWQRLAAENEAMVVSLNNTLVQIKEQQQVCCVTSSSCSSNEVGDEESCCNVNDNDGYSSRKRARKETEITAKEESEKTGLLCKVCKSRNSCVLLLPCRHLCCCKACVAFVDACPICNFDKEASIEALFS
ncbi:putative BOI-related E3 ubiquitin-protein ligase 3 [Bienertia sinuspersici]